MRREALAVLSMMLLATVAGAQEDVRANEPEAEEQEIAPEDRQQIRVLDHPYDIASFYRSAEGGYFWAPYPMGPGYGAGYGDPRNDRYPIAGYYRQRGGYYSQFWTGGYGYGGWGGYGGGGVGHGGLGQRGRGPMRPGLGGGRGRGGFGRSIGENGDLFLMTPAFLAPVGPLSGVFFSGGAK